VSNEIKVGFCVAYDWQLLQYALPLIYESADVICLSLDKDQISWSGNKYDFSELEFYKLVDALDYKKKIKIQKENYHLENLSPMQNEVRQRNSIASHMGVGGWHIQLDCDEYFLNFKEFVTCLKNLPERKWRRANVCCQWIILYKKVEQGYLYVDPKVNDKVEYMQIATREPVYEYGRRNGNFNIYTNFKILHQSWAREEQEIKAKIYNWGHSSDFEREAYLERWLKLKKENFKELVNFHPLTPEVWPALKFVQAVSESSLIEQFKTVDFYSFSKLYLFFKNSRFFSRIRKLLVLLRLKR
jgi:hypothetical protein